MRNNYPTYLRKRAEPLPEDDWDVIQKRHRATYVKKRYAYRERWFSFNEDNVEVIG